jgi:hypothetical protein
VVEHLVDCNIDTRLAELWDNGEVCIQNDWGGIASISGFVGQVATIGFLVMTYYFFKRTKGGVLDWQDEDEEDDVDDYEENEEYDDDVFGDRRGASGVTRGGIKSARLQQQEMQQKQQKRQDMRLRRCPQCNGTGKFDWGGSREEETCDLCLGAGSLAFPTKNVVRSLPSTTSSSSPSSPFSDNDDV